jgi:hypothetical protein
MSAASELADSVARLRKLLAERLPPKQRRMVMMVLRFTEQKEALADELERDVLALADEVDQLRTRAEAAEAELREVRRG